MDVLRFAAEGKVEISAHRSVVLTLGQRGLDGQFVRRDRRRLFRAGRIGVRHARRRVRRRRCRIAGKALPGTGRSENDRTDPGFDTRMLLLVRMA